MLNARVEPADWVTSGRVRAAPRPANWAVRRRITAEIWVVLGLSLGQSAVYAVIALVAKLTAGPPLASQSTALNVSRSTRTYVDLSYQLAGIFFAVVPVALALYLLSASGRSAARAIGLDFTQPARDLGWGITLAAVVGIPGLGSYIAGRALGITVQVQASALNAAWWTVPVLVLSALQNGLLEEVIVVGYLFERTRDLGWQRLKFMIVSSVLRGSYHLYQGFGPFFGNIAMGLVFSWFYTSKWGRRRTMPLVIAHTLLDIVAFVGYALIPAHIREALGIK